jgi:hypothetical protein
VAIDVSPEMVALVANKTRHLPNARVERAGFLTYRHREEPAEFVYSRNSLHHLPDLWKVVALQCVKELMAPEGTLFLRDIVFSAAQGELQSVIEAWLNAAPPDTGVGWTRSELERHLIDEHSTHSALLETMLIETGFEVVDALQRVEGVRTVPRSCDVGAACPISSGGARRPDPSVRLRSD